MRRNWGVALEELPDVTEGIRTELIQRNQGDGALAFASLYTTKPDPRLPAN